MTDYKNIHGKRVKFFTSDLGNAQAEGQIFYSGIDATASAAGVFNFKTAVSSAAWSSAAPLLTATRGIANTGSETASVAYGGFTTTLVATTLEYNGSGWASGENMPSTQSEKTKGGTQTAVIAAGGDSGDATTPAGVATIEYDGTEWTRWNSRF